MGCGSFCISQFASVTPLSDAPIYCLNLARRPDRRIQAWQQFRREGLEIARLIAPDAMSVTEARGWRNKGARACAAAHRLAWREARREGAEAVIVFEDDVVLCRGFRERLEALELPEDWAVLYFGCVFREPPELVLPGLLRVTGPSWDMHGYMLRRRVWEELGRELGKCSWRQRDGGAEGPRDEGRGGNQGAGRTGNLTERGKEDTACDVILAERHGRYPAYAVWPPMAWQVAGLSNNENSVRGNYRKDGTQGIYRECIRHLPGVEGEVEGRRDRGTKGQWDGGEEERSHEAKVGRGCARADTSVDGGGAEFPGRADGQGVDESLGVLNSARAQPRPTSLFKPAAPGRRFLVSPYSPASERLAYALVCSLRRYNPDIPVCVLGQDYVCTLPWRGLATVKTVRAPAAHGSDDQWFNKLGALLQSPTHETIFLDCDMVLLADPAGWFEALGTDDFTCFNRMLSPAIMPKETEINVVNVHRMREEFGVESVPVIDGGGHFYYRKTERGRRLVEATAAIMSGALQDGAGALYHRMAGPGNCAASDEIAFSIAAVQEGIVMPREWPAATKPISVFLPPHQHHETFDLAAGVARFYDNWSRSEVQPHAVHFCHRSKQRPEYVKFVADCLRLKRAPQPGESPGSAPAPKVLPRALTASQGKRRFLFDLGHHYGEGLGYLRELYGVNGDWTVFTFEPNSRCREALQKAAAEGVVALPLAVHSAPGAAVFQREACGPGGAEDGQGSHLKELEFDLDRQGGGQEAVWKVDFPLFLRSLIAPGREHSFVVVKMDIEGAEYDILRAMLADGSIDLVDVLHVEFHDRLMPAESEETTGRLRAALRKRVDLVEHW